MSFEVKIKEGAKTILYETPDGFLIYIITIIIFYSIPYKYGLGIFLSSLVTIFGVIIVTSYITETFFINEKNIITKKTFGLRRQLINFSEIKRIDITKARIRSSSYNYLITIYEKKNFKINLISIKNLRKMIDAIQTINSNVEITFDKEVKSEIQNE